MFFKHTPVFSLISSIGITLLFFLGKIFYTGGTVSCSLFDLSYLSGTYEPSFFKAPFIYPALMIPAGLLLIFGATVLSFYRLTPALYLNLAGSLFFLSYPIAVYQLTASYPVKPKLILHYIQYSPAAVSLFVIIFFTLLLAGYTCFIRKSIPPSRSAGKNVVANP